jgi:phosphoglycolate phosphatase-like HAD superfamily hydrolase
VGTISTAQCAWWAIVFGMLPSATLGAMSAQPRVALFDLDGTLVDSDAALIAPFTSLGVAADRMPPLGLPLGEACAMAGVLVDDYLVLYDHTIVQPFPGVDALLRALPRWAVCSNKASASGQLELERLGWKPELALFSEDFAGQPKHLPPVLEALALDATGVVFVGDTAHDRSCAAAVGATFALAGWNPRAVSEPADIVLRHPSEVLDLLR